MNKLSWKLIPFALFVVLVLFLGKGLFLEPQNLPSAQIGKPLPDFKIPLLLNPTMFFTPADLKNQVSLLNIWASWCGACKQEHGFLLKLASQGIPIYGINYQDNPKLAKNWLITWGNPFKLVAEDKDGRLGMDLGVYGAPETFLIDKNGIIRYRHVGILTKFIWKKRLLPLKLALEKE